MGGNYERGIFNQLQEVMARLDAVEKDLKEEKTEHREDVRKLNSRIAVLETENTKLKNENARLKSIINNDSSNTSLPPSTDSNRTKSANEYNSRQKSGKKAGGQKGHKGITLDKKEIERKIKCGNCRHVIKNIGIPKGRYITKYVVDLDIEEMITEIRIYANDKGRFEIPEKYYSDVTYGDTVKGLAINLYSEGVMANDRIAGFINSLTNGGLHLSNGSVYNFCRKFSKSSEPYISIIEEELLNRDVLSTDATVVTLDGKQAYIRNLSTPDTALYVAMKKKAIKALEEIRTLKLFTGTLIHDHESALYHFGTEHGECNVHLIRYLRKNEEETGNTWSAEMIKLLTDINDERKKLKLLGMDSFSKYAIKTYELKYDEIVLKGRAENKHTKHRYAKQDEKTLLNRLTAYKSNHLLFMHDFRVDFDNNLSERDLRKVKNREKMAGGFRKDSGHKMYCAIMTMIETFKKRGIAIFEGIKQIFNGTLAIN